MTNKDKDMVAKALRTEMSAISLRQISIFVFPFAKLKKFKVAIAKVLVLIPPPVEEGDAPIHINAMMIMIEEKCNSLKSIELKPAVRGVVAVKSAVTIFHIPSCPRRVL